MSRSKSSGGRARPALLLLLGSSGLGSFGLGSLAPVLGACVQAPGPAIAAHSAVLPLTGPCPLDATAGTEFTSEAQSLRLTVTAKDMSAPVVAEGGLGSLTVDEVPAGTGRFVGLFGLVAGRVAWRGVVRDVTLEPDEDKELNVLMARLNDLSCSRGTDGDKRAFHTATVLKDGSVLIVGGAKESTDVAATCGAGCRRLTPTTSAAVWDPTTGSFTPVGTLSRARLFHTATLLEDGRVVIVGGAGGGLVWPEGDAAHPFPIEPLDPIADVEVYDPDARTFTSGGIDPQGARIFAAATTTGNGEAIVTGGIPAANLPRNDLGNATSSTTICGGTPLFCRAGPTMAARRAGHVAFFVKSDGVFAWGGAIDPAPGEIPVEVLRSDGGGFDRLPQPPPGENFGPTRQLFFAAAAQYLEFRMLIAGGLERRADGSFVLALADTREPTSGGPVLVLDLSAGTAGGVADGRGAGSLMQLQRPRFFGAAAPLPGNTRALMAGGYSSLAFSPSAELEMFDQSTLRVFPLEVGGSARVLREPRGGLVATANGDGTIVFFGGEAPNGGGRGPVSTAEIFADPLTPPEVAE
jgi:hypothetical protein